MGETVVNDSVKGRIQMNYEEILRRVCREVGYDDESKGLDYKNMTCLVNVVPQS